MDEPTEWDYLSDEMQERIIKMQQRISELEVKLRGYSVNEKLPEEPPKHCVTRCIGCLVSPDGRKIVEEVLYLGRGNFDTFTWKVVHWWPLPEVPTDNDGGLDEMP